MKVGLVTYQVGNDLALPELIELCEQAKLDAVELRTTHGHGVEPSLSPAERAEVRRRFEDSPVMLWGLGSTCEYHSPDPEVLRQNIAETARFVELARDVGAVGVKVRPNGFAEDAGISKEQTLRQIGNALRECGEHAAQYGIELWLEVHGRGTSHPPYIAEIMKIANHPQVKVCWNCNAGDIVDGSIAEYFNLCAPWIRSAHIHDLYDDSYPWRELIELLKGIDFDGCCLAEMADTSDRQRVMSYYAALWREMTG